MVFTSDAGAVPIHSWCERIEPGAWKQALNLANHPAIFRHVALMPDCHEGYGMPIGGVIACNRALIPNAVGVDIGCGMCAVKTSVECVDVSALKSIMAAVRERIPLGFNHRKQKVAPDKLPAPDRGSDMPVVAREFENARTQIGTLGGGNHFIEFQKDSSGHLWVMIHSGSRNVGKQVADHYNRLACERDAHRRVPMPTEWQLAYLETDSREGQAYLAEMQYCVDFAFANRRLIMEVISEIVLERFRGAVEFDPVINIAHNYAALEWHFGRDVWVHRKGATLAREGTIGIIPGSQGTASYIVRGKGNHVSFESCSHGAGRRMGRKQAQRELSLADEIRKLDNQGIVHAIRGKHDLDEASGAYKDIGAVMASQRDLVDIVEELRPMGVIKG